MSTGGGGGSGGCDGGAAAAATGTAGAGAGDLAGSAGCMMLDRSMPGGGFRCDTGTVSPQRQIRSLPPWISPSHAMRCSVCSSIISGRWLVGGRQVRYARSGRHSKQAASKKRSRDGGSEGTAAHRPKVRGTSISDVDVEVARAPCDELEQSLERRDSDRSSKQYTETPPYSFVHLDHLLHASLSASWTFLFAGSASLHCMPIPAVDTLDPVSQCVGGRGRE